MVPYISPSNVTSYDATACGEQDCVLSSNRTDPTHCSQAVHIAHETDCNKFVTCLSRKTEDAQALVSSCPDGMHFNAKISVCDWPKNSNCKVVMAQQGCSVHGERMPHTGDCSKYIECLCPNTIWESTLNHDCP